MPDVAVASAGDFVVVWHAIAYNGTDNLGTSTIQGRRFSSAATPLADSFQLNTYTTGDQESPAVDIDGSGALAVIWESTGSGGNDNSQTSIQMRRFDSTGDGVGNDFQVNTFTDGAQGRARVAADSAGNFIVTWVSYGSLGGDDSGRSIQAQRFNTAGAPVGGEFQVNSFTTYNQEYPDIAMDANGDFTVVWGSDGSPEDDTSYYSVQGQFFGSNGALQGTQFQVNSYTTYHQNKPVVAGAGSGTFVVLWNDYPFGAAADGDELGVFGQRYGLGDALIFADGFESGDTTVWSATSP